MRQAALPIFSRSGNQLQPLVSLVAAKNGAAHEDSALCESPAASNNQIKLIREWSVKPEEEHLSVTTEK
jgi:hypothetical protein